MSWTLKRLRENYHLTIKEVCEQLGLNPTILQKYEKDSSEIPITLAQHLANFYNVPLDDVFLGKEQDFKQFFSCA